MRAAGTGMFFDGTSSAKRAVLVELDPEGLVIRDAEERHMLARWPYDQLDHLAAPGGVLRLGRAGAQQLARLEVRDPDLAHKIDDASLPVDRSGAIARRGRMKVVTWSFAAMASLVLGGVYGIPALADRIAPFVPVGVERWLGRAVDGQVRAMLDKGGAGEAFECGSGPGEGAGQAALTKLIGKLEARANLHIPLSAKAVRRGEANAIALPGGRVYVFQGLIDRSERPDELAGVLAHEIGHVAHRDGTRSILQAAGVSFLFGMLLGDFVGGSAVVLGARAVLQKSYSRDVETSADAFSVDLMQRVGADARALGTILNRIAGANHPGMVILRDHPDTKLRVSAINSRVTSTASHPLLEPSEWAALKRICAGR